MQDWCLGPDVFRVITAMDPTTSRIPALRAVSGSMWMHLDIILDVILWPMRLPLGQAPVPEQNAKHLYKIGLGRIHSLLQALLFKTTSNVTFIHLVYRGRSQSSTFSPSRRLPVIPASHTCCLHSSRCCFRSFHGFFHSSSLYLSVLTSPSYLIQS